MEIYKIELPPNLFTVMYPKTFLPEQEWAEILPLSSIIKKNYEIHFDA
jgi:hypothetical protein